MELCSTEESGCKGQQRLWPHRQQRDSPVTIGKEGKGKFGQWLHTPGPIIHPVLPPRVLVTAQSPGNAWKWIISLPAQRAKSTGYSAQIETMSDTTLQKRSRRCFRSVLQRSDWCWGGFHSPPFLCLFAMCFRENELLCGSNLLFARRLLNTALLDSFFLL